MGSLVGSTPRVVGAGLVAMAAEKVLDHKVGRRPVRSQLAAIGWCLRGSQALPLVVQSQAAIKTLMHGHLRSSVTRSIHSRLNLEATVLEAHHVVRADGALVLETEHLLGDESRMGWPVSRSRLSGWYHEAPVVAGQEVRH
jgi:hypothetical protein